MRELSGFQIRIPLFLSHKTGFERLSKTAHPPQKWVIPYWDFPLPVVVPHLVADLVLRI